MEPCTIRGHATLPPPVLTPHQARYFALDLGRRAHPGDATTARRDSLFAPEPRALLMKVDREQYVESMVAMILAGE